MSTVLRRNRKGSDRDITRLNSLGFSLSTIGERLSCHPTSITLRLKSLKIPPADTRRAFMEDIFKDLPEDYQDDIADLLEANSVISIKDYIRELINADITERRSLGAATTQYTPLNAEALESVIEGDGTNV